MKKYLMILSLIVFIFSLVGCIPKTPKIVYVKQEAYEFQRIDLEGVYIEKENKSCSEIVSELQSIYKSVILFYEEQIEDYEKQFEDDEDE